MISVEHRASHLYREDAYREYCWSVDAFSSYQPASFIYLCFESFKDACADFGLRLIHRTNGIGNDHFSWRHERDATLGTPQTKGLILRIEGVEDADLAVESLKCGHNVIALIPSELFYLFYPQDATRLERSKAGLRKLGIDPNELQVRHVLRRGVDINWTEIPNSTAGRLFTIHDSFLSDGAFMKDYGWSKANHDVIQLLIKEFAVFKHNILNLSYNNTINKWPTGEPLTVIVDVTNNGPEIEGAKIVVNLSQEFEPLSPLDRIIPKIGSLQHSSFALQILPRVHGSSLLAVSLTAYLSNGNACDLISDPFRLDIIPALGSPQRSSVPEDDASLIRLVTAFQEANMRFEVDSLTELARIDARACLNKIRVLTEKIVTKALAKKHIASKGLNLSGVISVLRERKLVSVRTISYLNTIRIIGNMASHASPEPLSDADVRILSYALASVVEEFIEIDLI